MLKQIRLRNILSFGPSAEVLELRSLNVVIGPNGSGKSNLIEAISLLRSSPRELVVPVREGGGVRDWLWKGGQGIPVAELDAVLEYPQRQPLRHVISFTEAGQRFEVTNERIENSQADPGHAQPHFFFGYTNGRPMLNTAGQSRRLERADIDPEKSILAQRRDPDNYPEITFLANCYDGIRLYRDWAFGRYTAPRLPQKADLPNDFLAEDASNLALVLNTFRRNAASKRALLDDLQLLYDGIHDFDVIIEGGTVQLFLNEGDRVIPATRLSDGTLRFLCLLSILHHPSPPSLVCIEEPELGLHPDVLPRLAELLREASAHTQLIVTTHSDTLVGALTEDPETVVVAEKQNGSTSFNRLQKDRLAVWLEKYSLGELWTRGQLGGTRW